MELKNQGLRVEILPQKWTFKILLNINSVLLLEEHKYCLIIEPPLSPRYQTSSARQTFAPF